MAAKDSKSGKKMVDLGPTLAAKVSISRIQWIQAMKDKERSNAILWDIGMDIMLTGIILGTFPRQNLEDAEKLMGNPNINMILKAKLAYVLQLIDKTVLNDLKQIHNIRNKFAHSFDANFADTEVLKLVRKLSITKGQEVTQENSYKFYESTVMICTDYIMAVLDKQKLKNAQQG